mmetsp:Transcript_20058/g.28822  ORF Transcript_20058/g.28822 Transcript_20058/m.28822 type:complete len:235 (+) Transcript_20058:59-763(+)
MTKRSSKVEEAVWAKMASVPTAPIVSDEYVAQLLAAESSKRMELSKRVGVLAAFTGNATVGKGAEINKTFLANTIRGVESHNRREECADCWRQHDMMKKAKTHTSSTRHPRRNSSVSSVKETSLRKRPRGTAERSHNVYDNDREYWAALKAQKLSAESSTQGPDVSVPPLQSTFVGYSGSSKKSSDCSSNDSASSDSDSSSSKKHSQKKKHKSAKKHKKKKKSKHKHAKEKKKD